MTLSLHKTNCPFCKGLHWHKYRYLENKLIDISKYVTIDKNNFHSWGEEFADLFVLIGNEMDTFFRDMYDCPNFQNDPSFLSIRKNKNNWAMNEYRKVYEPYYEFSENTVTFELGLGRAHCIKPFSSFSKRKPNWWTAYNKIKHEYYDHLQKANLRNIVNCLGGLLLLNALHFCSKWRINQDRLIRSSNPHEQLAYEIVIGEPLEMEFQLLKSKKGTTKFAAEIYIETDLFRFNYRIDEDISTSDQPFIKF